jgi:hypothetical protein
VYWPALVPAAEVEHTAVLPDGTRVDIPATWAGRKPGEGIKLSLGRYSSFPAGLEGGGAPGGTGVRAPLGRVCAARSGDKGGNANVGVWTRTDDGYDWMQWFLTVERLRGLMPTETDGLEVTRVELPNLRALNFVIKGLLGRGVAASTRTDPQAKGLGEYLRAKVADVPITLLAGSLEATDRV